MFRISLNVRYLTKSLFFTSEIWMVVMSEHPVVEQVVDAVYSNEFDSTQNKNGSDQHASQSSTFPNVLLFQPSSSTSEILILSLILLMLKYLVLAKFNNKSLFDTCLQTVAAYHVNMTFADAIRQRQVRAGTIPLPSTLVLMYQCAACTRARKFVYFSFALAPPPPNHLSPSTPHHPPQLGLEPRISAPVWLSASRTLP